MMTYVVRLLRWLVEREQTSYAERWRRAQWLDPSRFRDDNSARQAAGHGR
jgi:hypothetical protein